MTVLHERARVEDAGDDAGDVREVAYGRGGLKRRVHGGRRARPASELRHVILARARQLTVRVARATERRAADRELLDVPFREADAGFLTCRPVSAAIRAARRVGRRDNRGNRGISQLRRPGMVLGLLAGDESEGCDEEEPTAHPPLLSVIVASSQACTWSAISFSL